MPDNKVYGQGTLSSLKDEEQVRQKPWVIFGTNDPSGAFHGIYEIIANSIDEAREGYGKQIRVTIHPDDRVEISDDGRGIPMEWNENEKKFNWELAFCTLYASGKYNASAYSSSVGLNGLGLTAMQFASEFMEAYSTYNGKTFSMKFKRGRPVGKLQVSAPIKEGTGTTIIFKPDSEVFEGIKGGILGPENYVNLLRRQSMLLPGVEIVFNYKNEITTTFCYPNGVIDFIDAVNQHPILKKTMYFTDEIEVSNESNPEPFIYKMMLAFNVSRNGNLFELYHNGSFLSDGGTTYDGYKEGITVGFEDVAREIGKLGKSEHFSYKDIESLIVGVGSGDTPGYRTAFKNQTKTAVSNKEFKGPFKQFVYNCIRNWHKQDKTGCERAITEAVTNKTAREEAEKVSKKVVNYLSKSVDGMGNKPQKFVDCKSKDPYLRELYIVEGDSALGSVKMARDSLFQAIMPVRGKIINCLKENLGRVFNSEIIMDLLRVLGCGVEVQSKYIDNLPKFDLMKLRFGKVIICTDADVDGMQIRCLIITMLYCLAPTLLKAGKVYIAETPLYEIIYKNDVRFAYDEGEKERVLAEFHNLGISDKQIKINRSKGLGENDPEMMSKSTMHPDTRRLVPVEYPDNDEMVADIFNALLGNDIETRRILIQEWFDKTETIVD